MHFMEKTEEEVNKKEWMKETESIKGGKNGL